MLPKWKMRRELERLKQKMISIPKSLWEPITLKHHDLWFESYAQAKDGEQPLRSRVAIVLLYQPDYIRGSTIKLLSHLCDRGYSVLAVSNCPIAQEAWPIIVKLTWKVFERPNFGRCFGGYRDGVKLLFRLSISPERLVIMNDSIIYPLYEKDKTLETLENLECDISGIMMRKRGQTENLESYFLSISKNAFNHKGFKKFWDNYRPTSDKQKTIKRGERGFSIAMSQCGLIIKSLYKRETFETCLKQLTDAELFQTIKYQAVLYPNIARQGQHLLLSTISPKWRELSEKYIYRSLAKGEFYSTFPLAAFKFLNYPVLKNSMDPASELWRSVTVSAVCDGALEKPNAEAWSEIYNLGSGSYPRASENCVE